MSLALSRKITNPVLHTHRSDQTARRWESWRNLKGKSLTINRIASAGALKSGQKQSAKAALNRFNLLYQDQLWMIRIEDQ
jgi:hypothetical protein